MKASISGLESASTRSLTSSVGQSHHLIRSSASTCSSLKRRPISRAGLPTTIAYGRTSLATTAFVPTTAPSPIVTPDITVQPLVTQVSAPTTMSPLPWVKPSS